MGKRFPLCKCGCGQGQKNTPSPKTIHTHLQNCSKYRDPPPPSTCESHK